MAREGGGTVNRLASRLDRAQLSRTAMPGGGEVYKGDLATRALDALGARAMTMDGTIIVSDDFDPSKPEDQALFAHEQFHVEQSGGAGGEGSSGFADAEEVAARAVERMVLHRASIPYEGGYQPGGSGAGEVGSPWHEARDTGGHGKAAGAGSASVKPEPPNVAPDAKKGYDELIARGYSHMDVVDELARKTVAALDELHQTQQDRHHDKKGWL